MTPVVGHARRSYADENVVYGAVHPDLSFRRVLSLPIHRLTRDPLVGRTAHVLSARGADLVHLYNGVARFSPVPWVASFEDDYPLRSKREGRRAKAIALAASDRCRAVLAISEHARRRLSADPEAGPALLPKARVVLPCVPRFDDLAARHQRFLSENPAGRDPVKCLFVGHLFFLKGGEFVLDALEPLAIRRDPPVTLSIVSAMEIDTYVSRADEGRRRAVLERIARSPWISHVGRVSPREVRERMAESHLLLLPTLNDTFGFAFLDAMACGLDVVTVLSRAVPEILPESLHPDAVRLPVNEREEWAGTRLWRTEGETAWRRRWDEARERVIEAIRARVRAAADDPGFLSRRFPTLRAAYEARFTPEALGERLVAVYREVLGA